MALSDPLDLALGGDYRLEDGTDVRNYGGLTGIPEARRLGAEMLGVSPDSVIAGGNSSLSLMYQYVLNAWLNGPVGPGSAWRAEASPLRFLCVVPGYDRHFTITQSLGFVLVSVPIGDDGPDMDMVETLVRGGSAHQGNLVRPQILQPDRLRLFGRGGRPIRAARSPRRPPLPDPVGQRVRGARPR